VSFPDDDHATLDLVLEGQSRAFELDLHDDGATRIPHSGESLGVVPARFRVFADATAA